MDMPEKSHPIEPRYREWLRGPLVLIAALVVVRFVLEAAGVSKDVTRYFSGTIVGTLVLIYLGALAPLRGITRYGQLLLPALIISAWAGGWDALSLIVSAAFHLPGSHFADAPLGFQNWHHVGTHIFIHLVIIVPGALINFGLISLLLFLHRWPVVVGPSAVLGGLVTLRFAAEAMNFAPTTASAWSSTVGVLVAALYVGGIGSRWGIGSAKQLLAPSLALGWVWRLWIFLAVLASATGLFKTHFFDPAQGRVGVRLLEYFGGDVIVVGTIAGLLVWGIAAWTFYATRSES